MGMKKSLPSGRALAVAAWLAALLPALAYAQTVVRGPYLQSGTPSGVIVKWRTDETTDSVVRYGLAPNSLTLSATNSDSTTEHAVQLTGLSADVKYFYSVGASSGTLAGGDDDHFVVTAPDPGTAKPTRIWVIGCSGTATANAGAVRDAFLNFTGPRDPDLWIMLGDNAYGDGTDAEYQSAVFEIYPQVLARTVLWPTLGNHDGHTADSITESGPYYDIFSLPRNGEAGGVPSGTEAYYSFDYGNIHFIVLDSYETDRSPDGAMMTWLEEDLQATDKEWVIAFWHHPPYSKGTRDSDTQERSIEMRQNAVPLVEQYGVDLVLAAHSHSYERSHLIDSHYGLSETFTDAMKKSPGDGSATGDGAYQKPATVAAPHAGAVYVVAGSSGKRKEGPFGHPAMVVSMATLGSVVLDVNGNRLDAVFLDGGGDIRDDFTILKVLNTAPTFDSPAAFDAAENQRTAGTVLATDSDAGDDVTGYAITGGADQALFEIGATDGALTFDAAPNFEDAKDDGANNTYAVEVQATSGAGERVKTATRTITVTVTDVAGEAPGKPDAPNVSAASATSLTVNWSAPSNAGPAIDDYDVQYREGASGSWTDGNYAGTATTATLTGLSENTSYQVQVRATNDEGTGDWSDAGSGATDANAAPSFTSEVTFTVDEGKTVVETLTAEDQDTAAADLEWSRVGGADAGRFTLSDAGVLAFAAAPDYESPTDSNEDNVYEVTVQVDDGTHTDTEDLVVTVKNVDEDGAVSLFPAQLRVRTVVRATLTDPDGDLSAVSWRWAESSDKTTWTNIDGATQADYLPTEARRGKYLRATATRYRDGEGSNKTSRTESNAVVGAREPGPELSVKTLVSGLRFPWGIAFTPDGTMLFTERDGHPQQDPLPDPPEGLSSLRPDGTLQTVSADFSDLDTDENGGVMGLEVDPDFVDNRRIYICQQHTGSVIQVVAWTIDATYTTASRANDPLVGNIPRVDNHNGCRLRFGPDGNLWISTGDTEAIGTVPQDLNSLGGKILRVDPLTGAAPADNPFPGSLVYSYGHRNPQGLALRPGTRQMWAVEHGPTVDDEINLLRAGANYGWDPVPTDENGDPTSGYDDTAPMTDLVKFPGAVEARWSSGDPTLATSGGIFLEGEQWGLWEGRLAVATLKGRSLRIFEFTEDGTFVSHVVPEELDHFGDRDHRLRTPMIGPDHALYLSTSTRGWRDEILRVTPQQPPEFPNDADTRQVTENTGGDMVVATVEATDYNHDELTYTLDGADRESFYILDENIGELRVRSTTQLDFETRREYEVTVTATDAQNTSDTVTLTIEVIDIEHEGTVSLPLTQPRVGSPVQASLSDPDGGVTGATWQWERSDDGVTGWEDIDGARSASYTPGTDDIGKYLRATATYTNTHGPGKTAQSVTSDAVGAVPNSDPEFPSAPVVRRVAEHTPEGQPIGSPVEADDADGDPLRYTLSGRDGNLFGINTSSGQLLTRAALDYEVANEYEVDVSVSDGKDTNAVSDDNKVDDSVRVTIEVTNVDEPGSVSLLPAQLRVWTVVRATLSDPDGVDLHAVSWQWAASSDGVSWTPVPAPEGTQADYAPTDIVQGQYLRATASYTDGQGAGKRAEVVSDNVVGERESGPELTVVPLVSGLSVPWGVAFAPDGTMLFTERGDRLSSRLTDGTVQSVSADFDDLLVSGEAGLMAIVVDPAFASNRRFYTCQAHTGRVVQVIAWTFNDDTYTAATRAEDPLVGNIPAASRHSGCRLRFGPQGYLWIATGDASAGTVPQDRNSLGGKILRVDPLTGAAPADNPFPGSLVYSYGHRNVQGLARRPGTNQMWSVEHGPTVDDEINLLSAGGNYGWDPVPGYNEGVPMTDLVKFPGAVEARWSSGNHTLATSGGIFLEGEDWGEWDGRLAVAALKAQLLHVFEFTADGAFASRVAVAALAGAYGRLRTPMLGPDGALYVTTSNGRGQDKILRVSASRAPAFLTDTETRNVAENDNISTFVAKVLALDSDGDTLTYTLSGPEAESFSIPDAAVGAIQANVAFDYEAKRAYEVTVTATDPQGLNDSTTLTINVTDTDEPPAAPGAPMVSAKARTTDSLDVIWTAPANDGPAITDYDHRHRTASPAGSWTEVTDTAITGTRATIAGLAEGTSYDVQVRATNDEGAGAWSDSGSGSTNANAAPSFVSSAAFGAAENQTAAGTVRASDGDSVDDVTGYAITGGADRAFFSIGAPSGALTFDAAPNYEDAKDQGTDNTYAVEVRATSGTGERERTATQAITVTVTDVGGEAPGRPAAPNVSAASATSLNVGWSAPANAGPAITDYDHRHRTASPAGSWTEVTDTAITGTRATIAGLAEGTSYDVQVRATNDEGAGAWSDSGTDSTDANAAPSFTSNAEFDAAENQTAAGTVRASDGDSEDDITGYAITGGADRSFFSIGATSGTLTFDAGPNFEDARDQGADNIYAVEVRATSGTGERERTATQAITVTVTDVGGEAPGRPAAPDVSAASVTSLTVNWSAPSNAGPAIDDYDVQYREGASGSWTDGNYAGTATTATLTGLSENTSYQVQVRATNDEGAGDWSDAGSGATDANAAPTFNSSATFDAAENQTAAGTVRATDSDSDDDVAGYAITGGADRTFFSIGATSGALTFKAAPNFEDAKDQGADNTYVVEVTATSGAGERVKTATQTITVTVTDMDTEAPEPEDEEEDAPPETPTDPVAPPETPTDPVAPPETPTDPVAPPETPTDPVATVAVESEEPPDRVALIGNYPNPFNPSTGIVYELPEPGPVRLAVYDMIGREVRVLVDAHRTAGRHTVRFDAEGLPTGTYACVLTAGSVAITRVMVLVR